MTLLTSKEILAKKAPKGYSGNLNAKTGIYFLIHDNQIIYVGKAVNLYQRLKLHDKIGKIDYDSFSFIEMDRVNAEKEERKYIVNLCPKENKALKPSPLIDSKIREIKVFSTIDEAFIHLIYNWSTYSYDFRFTNNHYKNSFLGTGVKQKRPKESIMKRMLSECGYIEATVYKTPEQIN